MSNHRLLAATIVAGSVAVASLFAAAPAAAATLPDGQKITVQDTGSNQYYLADPSTAALTEVGTGGVVNQTAYVQGIDVDDTGYGYAIGFYGQGDGSLAGGFVQTADANTGTLGPEVGVTVVLGPEDIVPVDACWAIDYSGGTIVASCVVYGIDGPDVGYVGTVDPVTGILVPTITLDGSEPFPYLPITAIALDPISGVLYGFTQQTGDGAVFEAWILSADGVQFVTTTDNPVVGADFDRGGQLWVTTATDSTGYALATLDLTTGANPFLAGYVYPTDLGAQITSITVWGLPVVPVLPNTGFGADALPMTAGAAGILLLGAFLAAGALLYRRRSAE